MFKISEVPGAYSSFLEETGFAGLVTSDTVFGWATETEERFFKMAKGRGFVGRSNVFDPARFDSDFLDGQSSESYRVFYNREVHDVGKLLATYLEILLKSLNS